MARATRASGLETRAARDRIPVGPAYHWIMIGAGLSLGYRKGAKARRWYARFTDPAGVERKPVLGTADDFLDPDGERVLSYFQAQDRARAALTEALAPKPEPAAPPEAPYTVADAMSAYLDWLDLHRAKTTAKGSRIMSAAHIGPTLGTIHLDDLTTPKVRDWLAALARAPARRRRKAGAPAPKPVKPAGSVDPETLRRRKATANRVFSLLRAALNHAWSNGKAPSADAWKRVKPFDRTDKARVRYISVEEVRRLINAADPDFRPLVRAAVLTGARYAELRGVRAGDFHPDAQTLRIAEPKSGRVRYVPLTTEGVALFEELTAGRPADAPVFVRTDGKPWAQDWQIRPMRAASERAGISPPVHFHLLRHAYGSLLARAGTPLQVIAAALGHGDTRMTHRHYAHLQPDFVAQTVRANLPTFAEAPTPPKVRRLRRKGA
ncbi:MAG: site-specific integrase [Gammaproteobacteria bacterium]|nr:site-specific integrase [Gammaproteobacteria bacterium]